MVEVLREDFDFDPDSEANESLLSKLLSENSTNRRRLFDISDASREAPQDRRRLTPAVTVYSNRLQEISVVQTCSGILSKKT